MKRNYRAEGAKQFSVKPDDVTKNMDWELQFGKLGLNARERRFCWKGSAALTVTRGAGRDI